MTLEMGKPVAESLGEVRYAADFLRWFAEEAVRIAGRYATAPARRRPSAGAEAAGRPVPADHAVELPARDDRPQGRAGVGRRMHVRGEAGRADAAVRTRVRGAAGRGRRAARGGQRRPDLDPAALTEPLLADPRLRKLSFTGSTEVGRLLALRPRSRCCAISLELGGNAPFLVFADADLDAAVDGAMQAKMRNGGEACTVGQPLPRARVGGRASSRCCWRSGWPRCASGRGTEPGVQLGPLIDEADGGQGAGAGRRRRRRAAPGSSPAARVEGRAVLGADRARRRAARGAGAARGDLRSGGADHDVRRRGGGDRRCQRHRVRPGGLRVHPRPGPRAASGRRAARPA